jgi:predicted kinase
MNFLIIMVGIPASGKSTWAEQIKKEYKENCEIVSRDSIRFSMPDFTSKFYFKNEKKVYDIYIDKLVESLTKNKITIADATHINQGSRKKLFYYLDQRISKNKYVVIYAIADTTKKECLKRNSYREINKIVPEETIERLYQNFRLPSWKYKITLSEWNKKLWHSTDTVGKKKLRSIIKECEKTISYERIENKERNE